MKPRLRIDSEWCGFEDYYPVDEGLDARMYACWGRLTITEPINKAISSELDKPELYRVEIRGNNDGEHFDGEHFGIWANFRNGAWKQDGNGDLIFSVSDRIT